MQFKNPEILYFLFLLIIPILIHLFQLQKFEKVAFTNVKLLKQIEQQTRKSSKLKKLLILLSRLLLFASLIIAFAQPYYTKNQTQLATENFIYLDNSLSMQAKGEKGELLQSAKQEIIELFQNNDGYFTLITNDEVYKNQQIKNIKNELLKINYKPVRKDMAAILVQIDNLKNKKIKTQSNIVLISDFQIINSNINKIHLDSTSSYSFVQSLPKKAENISVDSIWIEEQDRDEVKLIADIKSYQTKHENLNISLYNNGKLSGKATVSLSSNSSEEIEFILPKSNDIHGKISLNDNLLLFDNNFYFSLTKKEKSAVLAIGEPGKFLSKIYTPDEFNFSIFSVDQLDPGQIANQSLIILNGVNSISNSLVNFLKSHIEKSGNLVIIPAVEIDIPSYNNLLSKLQIGRIKEVNRSEKKITTINYGHPFFKNVFSEQVDNFQYPIVNQYFSTDFYQSSSILQFADKSDFISEINIDNSKIYWIASSLDQEITNFKTSPLIVPVFYNFSLQNTDPQNLYFTIGNKNTIHVKSNAEDQEVLHIQNQNSNFIPLQTKIPGSVILQTEEYPEQDGLYTVKKKEDFVQNLAFNYNRDESDLTYYPIKNWVKKYPNAKYFTSLKNALSQINDQNKKSNLWQLFIIFALLFLGIEIVLQKFF